MLFGIAILTAGVLLMGNLNKSLQRRFKLVAYINDVNGLQKGNYIWLSGVRIGTIHSLSLRGTPGVEVVMDVDSKVREFIYKNSKVKLGSDSFIGNRILIVFEGTPDAGTIEEGDTLQFEKTLSADDLIGTLQQNNENLKDITGDFKIISRKLAEGQGTLGKFLNDESFYFNLNSAASRLKDASGKAEELMSSLNDFSGRLKKQGTLAYELTSDTVVFSSVRASVIKLREIADTASVIVHNLKEAGNNPDSPIGLLLHDEGTGKNLKAIIENLEISTVKLNEDLEALQHSFPMKGYFRKKEKSAN